MDNDNTKAETNYIPPSALSAFEEEVARCPRDDAQTIIILGNPSESRGIDFYKGIFENSQKALISTYARKALSKDFYRYPMYTEILRNLIAAMELFGFLPVKVIPLFKDLEISKEDVVRTLKQRDFNKGFVEVIENLSLADSPANLDHDCSAYVLSLHCLREAIFFSESKDSIFIELINKNMKID